MYYYELNESDDDLYSDALLAHQIEYTPEQFFELTQATRRRVQATFEEDTLVEAVAHELERTYGFVYIDDAMLSAAVHLSIDEDDNFIAEVEDEDEGEGTEFRTLMVHVDRDTPPN